MNSYNDNLRNTVVSSLATQEVDKKTIRSEAIASMFTLYHAEGATIDAQNKLEDAAKDLAHKTKVNDLAVTASNISNNMLSSATQANNYAKQSVTNTAVSAANIQIATDSIVKLASDIGSVYSIVKAADFSTDIYTLTQEARTLINDTAYLAEVTSRMSMDASINTSEVIAQAVLDKAKNSNTSLSNLLAVTTSDFNNASATVTADTLNVGTASVAEQVAEGNFEDVAVEYKATYNAYYETNKNLNLNLQVWPVHTNTTEFDTTRVNDTVRHVSFDLIRSPFPWDSQYNPSIDSDSENDKSTESEKQKASIYPVKDYYLIAVKDASKSTFGMANAENIILSGAKNQYYHVPSSAFKPHPENGSKAAKAAATHHLVRKVNLEIDLYNINGKVMMDSEGDLVTLGTDYVFFLFATYEESYKKKINNFDDFLSAASVTFSMTRQLGAASISTLEISRTKTKEAAEEKAKGQEKGKSGKGQNDKTKSPAKEKTSESEKLEDLFEATFSVTENPTYSVEYRLMFLPVGKGLPKGMLNMMGVDNIEKESRRLMRTANLIDPQIAEAEAKLADPNTTAEEAIALNDKIKVLKKAQQTSMNNAILTSIDSSSTIDKNSDTATIGFMFNMTIAEQVTSGNYYSVYSSPLSASPKDKDHKSTGVSNKPQKIDYTIELGAGLTDIFGNLLEDRHTYVPVILSIFSGEETTADTYNNAWTGYNHSKVVTYPFTADSSK